MRVGFPRSSAVTALVRRAVGATHRQRPAPPPAPIVLTTPWPPLRLPSVSIIIATYNTAAMTAACIHQVLATVPPTLALEVLVIDDGSTDDTPATLAALAASEPRLRLLRNEQNLRFLHSCNCAATAAIGEVLVFLNSDTLPRPGWLEPLLHVLVDRPEAGAVGGKLLYPDGRLQEAGGIIFADGSGWNVGRNAPNPDDPLFTVLREVDYCSGALLATWRALFMAGGGFDPRFAPMYYEDADYCFALRARGKRVYYQPASVVVHLEGATAGTDLTRGAKAAQADNRATFAAKWAAELAKRPPPVRLDEAALRAILARGVPPAEPAAL